MEGSVLANVSRRTLKNMDAETIIKREKSAQKRDEAIGFILGFLSAGRRLSTDLNKAAEAAGISARTIKRARSELKQAGLLVTRCEGFCPKKWYIELIEQPEDQGREDGMRYDRNGSGYYDPTAYMALKNIQEESGMEIRRGDIFYINKIGETNGSVQEAGRPAVIVSNDKANTFSGIVQIVYLTTKEKNPIPTHTTVVAKEKSTALCEQVQSVSKERLGNWIKCCTDDEMRRIDACLMIALGLDESYNVPDRPQETKEETPEQDEKTVYIRDVIIKLQAENKLLTKLYDSMLERICGGSK